jgi:hypothetical protein
MDLMVPALGQLVTITVTGLALSLLARPLGVVTAPLLWAAALIGILVHVLRGWASSGAGISGLFDLLWAPAYIVWKLTLRFKDKGQTPAEWVKTTRGVLL